jgi:hypothetical protein
MDAQCDLTGPWVKQYGTRKPSVLTKIYPAQIVSRRNCGVARGGIFGAAIRESGLVCRKKESEIQ